MLVCVLGRYAFVDSRCCRCRTCHWPPTRLLRCSNDASSWLVLLAARFATVLSLYRANSSNISKSSHVSLLFCSCLRCPICSCAHFSVYLRSAPVVSTKINEAQEAAEQRANGVSIFVVTVRVCDVNSFACCVCLLCVQTMFSLRFMVCRMRRCCCSIR